MDRYIEACSAIFSHFEASDGAAEDFLDSVLSEFAGASDYEAKLHRAMAFMCRVRNQSPSFVPISLLPPEIMSRILWFVERCCLPKSRFTRQKAQADRHPVHPEAALEVCYRWRQITLTSRNLWSHIDLDLTFMSQEKLFLRALAFAAKSKQAPIDLHMRINSHYLDYQRLANFFHTIATRIRSFELECGRTSYLLDETQSLLANLFSCVAPGALRRLHIDAQSLEEPGFLVADSSNLLVRNGLISHPIPITEPVFEGTLSSLTSIQLDGIYPYWTSRAYAGLVELDLEFSQNCSVDINITEFELADLLRSSPGLQTLRFGLMITKETDFSSLAPDPVKLDELRLIQLTGRYPDVQEAVLRMIYPGQLPLQMAIEVTEHFSLLSSYWVEFINFISRSKITQLQIQGAVPFKVFLESSEIFPLLPQLQVLTLYGIVLGQAYEEILGDYDATSFLALLHNYNRGLCYQNLRVLRLVKCRIYWSDFRHMSGMHPTQLFILDRCEAVKARTRKRRFGQRWDWTDTLMDAALKICPTTVVQLKGTTGEFEDLNDFRLDSVSPRKYVRAPGGFAL
ncbi:hypothetical protein OPQ81_002109 [Rhizoctonia solani]|nr:hypothetical protein OPQ81_002109 [Rhizoctonia solani]